jgi:adenylate cyclase
MAEDKKPMVLVVDDTETNIDILVDTLDEDYDVSVAMDGESALEIAESEPPDLILLDIMMPGMDGYEVCKKLKENEETRSIPVIFCTAMSEIENETKGFELGAVDYITKPISPPTVKARVASHLKLKQKTAQLADLSQKLSKYLSPQVYVSIFRGEQDATIESKRKKLTVYFSDIVGFTSTTEGMETEDLTALLNNYLDEMSQIAIKHGGTIDKFIGDAILIFFGDPLSRGNEEDAQACVSMAIEMREKMKELQSKWYDMGIQKPFQIRAGINTGYCTVGNFGSKSRMDYTIIGSNVNIASRLESSAEPGQINISHETWSLVKDLTFCIKSKPIMVKGISHPVQSYQVVDFIENMDKEDKAEFVGYLSESTIEVAPDTKVSELLVTFDKSDPTANSVVVRDGEFHGLITSRSFLKGGATETDPKALLDQPVSLIMDGGPVVVESKTPFEQVVKRVLGREKNKIYDPIVVLENGKYQGIVTVQSLLEKTTGNF